VALAIQGLPGSASASADARETATLASSALTAQPIESIRSSFELKRTSLSTSAIDPLPLVQGSAAADTRARSSSYVAAAHVKCQDERAKLSCATHTQPPVCFERRSLGAQAVHARPCEGLEILGRGIPDAACDVSGGIAGRLPLGLGSMNTGSRRFVGFLREVFTRLAMLLRANAVLPLS
jgi:hypothetical protein